MKKRHSARPASVARANRHYIPGYVWHLTHRCHKKEYLLKFVRDRKRWVHWLFEAKKRFGLSVLDYMVTSNHVHLLVYDHKGRDVIPKSMQLIAARTGQEYNLRKHRKGAFWEDRYHATAIEKNTHLQRCLVYIDLNMVRAGVVDHPQMWTWSGFNQIQNPPARYRIIDLECLTGLLGFENLQALQKAHNKWIEASLSAGESERKSHWTEGIAVGSNAFVEKVRKKLGFKAKGRAATQVKGRYQLRENIYGYGRTNSAERRGDPPSHSGIHNTVYWNEKP